jgi:hypothetical protein
MKRKSIIGILLLSLAGGVSAAENAWIGGDQSAVPGSTFHVNANWSTGVAPTNATPDALLIDQDGANARWISSSSGFYLNGPMTIGSTNSPTVMIDFQSNRTTPPSNDNPAQILMGATVSILGSNTTVRIGAGLNLALNAQVSPFVLDPKATLCGDGMISLGRTAAVMGDYDYDNIRLQFGNGDPMPLYVLPGFVKTTGDIIITSTGSAGVNNRTTVRLDGKTLEGGNLVLGLKDIRPEAGDQSGFGAVDFSGGILDLEGDITFRSNPDGLKTDGTPLTEDSCLTDSSSAAAGGTLRLGGSFTNITTKAPAKWKIADVDFILDGDGAAVQDIEALSADLGDTATCCLDNYCWRTLTVKAGAHVRLVDRNDNNRISSAAEAVYVKDLVVESGATLDINGINVYAYGTLTINGTLVTNGGAATKLTKSTGVIRMVTATLGTTDGSAGLGMWIGAMAVGDVTGDGKNELFAITMDEVTTDDDCKLFALNYTNGVVSSLPNYPISDRSLGGGTANMFFNFIVDDLGNGLGNELHYNNASYSRVYAIDETATPHLISADERAHYAAGSFALADIDRDGSKEMICPARASVNNLRVYDTDTHTLKWAATLAAAADVVAEVGVADLDLDGHLEVFAVAKTTDGRYGLSAFRNNGGYYYGPAGSAIISNMPLATLISDGSSGGIAAADVDGDHYPEFIYTAINNNVTDGLTVMKQNGTVLFRDTSASRKAPGFALLDLDKSGVYEILYGDRLYSGNGTVLQTLPVPAGGAVVATATMPVLADFNGDQIPEAVYLCSTLAASTTYGRMICVYDFVSQSILPGFPVALSASGSTDTTWHAGAFAHWTGSMPLVADLDNNGRWEIIVGVGIDTDATTESPTLNIIDTPYVYTIPEGRRTEDYGWYSHRHGAMADFKFPAYVQAATVVILR